MTPLDAVTNAILPWVIRLAGLFWLLGAFALIRQIRAEMALDNMATRLERMARDFAEGEPPPAATKSKIEQWKDRDDAARRGWIAGQAVVLVATGISMVLMHPFASWMAALLVLGQGVYFIWREYTARHAPGPDAAAHARPTRSTVNAGWFSLIVAMFVWMAAFRGLLV